MQGKSLKNSDPKQARMKAQAYCAYQERYQQEVRDKLYEWGLWKKDVEEIIARLVSDNFINEERFAQSFVRGKHNYKFWGKNRIVKNYTGSRQKRRYGKIFMHVIHLHQPHLPRSFQHKESSPQHP